MRTPAWMAGLLLIVAGLALAQDWRPARGEAQIELAFFFSESTRDLETSARALRELGTKHLSLHIRPVFLALDFASLAQPSEEFARGIRELGDAVGQDFALHVYDEAGLALARELKLDRLPAYALISNRGGRLRAYVTYGTRPNLEELIRCGE